MKVPPFCASPVPEHNRSPPRPPRGRREAPKREHDRDAAGRVWPHRADSGTPLPQNVYRWTDGRAIYAGREQWESTGHDSDGKGLRPRPCLSAYIFPGVALGCLAAGAVRVPQDMFLAAAEVRRTFLWGTFFLSVEVRRALLQDMFSATYGPTHASLLPLQAVAEQVTEEDRKEGSVYPCLKRARAFSAEAGRRVAEIAYKSNIATNLPKPTNLMGFVESVMYDTRYRPYR